MPPTSSMPGALAKFIESNLAQLVDQLEPIIRQLLAHFIAASRPTTELDGHFDAAFFSDRELASRLLALLAKREREMPLLMAFLWALLRCSQLGLFCRLLGHHLVNVDNFEQFVKAKEPKPDLANLKVIAEDEEDKLADANVDQRIQFAERHSELLRLKLTDSGKVNQLLGEWKVMAVDREGLEQRRASRLLECNRLIQLLTMPTQHRRAYDAFCLALLLTRQFRLFCIFHGLADLTWMEQCWASVQLEQEANEAGEREKLPQQAEDEPLGVLADLNVESVDSGGVSVNYEFYQAHKEQVYANFTQPRGIALIINNYAFRYRSHREGTHADVENLNNLLRQLSYRVMVHNDLTAEQIHHEIHAFSQMPEHRGLDSAMVILLSHGEYGVILGSDEQFVELHLLRNYLNTQNAPGLAGKPKIMIVQACRGSNFDSGVTRAIQEECQHDGLLNLFYSRPKKGPMTVSAFNSPPPPSNSPSPRQSRAGSIGCQHFTLKMITEPTDADFLTAFATTPYYVSWRNSAAGTFFVQSLCEVFAKWAKEEDILTMLTRVNQKVAERQARQDNRVYKQVSLKESTLRKKFYFFPGVRQSPI